MTKLIYVDVEATGFDPTKHALTQVSAIIEVDGVEVDSINLHIDPTTYSSPRVIEKYNLVKSNRTLEEVMKYTSSSIQFVAFVDFLSTHANKNKSYDVLQPIGYNINHDISFIQEWFFEFARQHPTKAPQYDMFFSHRELDIYALVKFMRAWGLLRGDIPDDKLGTLCKHFNIELNWHDSQSDVRAAKQLHDKLRQKIIFS